MPLAAPADLTFAQSGIWLDQQLFPGKPVYNTGLALTIRGELRTDLFEIALRETIAESPGLQLPPRSAPVLFDLPVLDLREKEDSLVVAQHWMEAAMRRPIPLDDPALFEFALIRISQSHTIWLRKIPSHNCRRQRATPIRRSYRIPLSCFAIWGIYIGPRCCHTRRITCSRAKLRCIG